MIVFKARTIGSTCLTGDDVVDVGDDDEEHGFVDDMALVDAAVATAAAAVAELAEEAALADDVFGIILASLTILLLCFSLLKLCLFNQKNESLKRSKIYSLSL